MPGTCQAPSPQSEFHGIAVQILNKYKDKLIPSGCVAWYLGGRDLTYFEKVILKLRTQRTKKS